QEAVREDSAVVFSKLKESHSILRDMNPPITESSASNSYSSKCVRVEDEDPNHIDSDYIEDECKEDVVNENKKSGSICEKVIKGETNSFVVHNTRKRTEMLKGVNNNLDGREFKKAK
ncbi:18408_t:CDS:2, partial [Racocetra fulgida]